MKKHPPPGTDRVKTFLYKSFHDKISLKCNEKSKYETKVYFQSISKCLQFTVTRNDILDGALAQFSVDNGGQKYVKLIKN